MVSKQEQYIRKLIRECLDETELNESTKKVRYATFKTLNPKLTNKQRYNEVIKALKGLELIDNYGTIDDPSEVMSMRYPHNAIEQTTVAKYIIEHGEINCEGYDYGIIIDLRDDMLYVDYPQKEWANSSEYKCKGDLCNQSEETVIEGLNKQQHAERNLNDNFWKWFGNSKVVDKNGEPLIVYHGTDNKFDKFNIGKKAGLGGIGIYFSEYPLPQFGKNQMKVYLKIENPITRNTEIEGMREINSSGLPTRFIPDVFEKFPKFDGIINRMEIVVKNPNQIKSVDNDGTWNINDNNIYS